jgi:hypothetical protein
MWVFDGEEWTKDDGGFEPKTVKPEPSRPRYDELMPELQVIEIVPAVVPRNRDRDLPLLPTP